ncbi:hypothetical protein P154DRAFT_431098 [Amniculicola lignicola CBS 123094]|uniref:Mitochondrial cytochrome c oxidase assembly factor n=1 Tax=Amniculicola lignicola CBS 123094 TaxID=1392246 RepID=A0A6A5WKR2_9PLEO|nr:hypothetical protein P154DRAFT_431098 [Amniculicola lignicola CBS 123094]
MAGPNLEVFKFGMYIMFPIGIMYYFGTNLDGKFAVPDFWPKPGQTHKIPYDRDEIAKEVERLTQRNIEMRKQKQMEEARRGLQEQSREQGS